MSVSTGSAHLLNLSINILASPEFTFENNSGHFAAPNLAAGKPAPQQLQLTVSGVLQFAEIEAALNRALLNRSIEISEGFMNSHVVVENLSLTANNAGILAVALQFDGSFAGTLVVSGRPFYHTETETLQLQEANYDLKTKNLLLKTARWLFSKRISAALQNHAAFQLSAYKQKAIAALNGYLNRNWNNAVTSSGKVQLLNINSIAAQPAGLQISSTCSASLSLSIALPDLRF